MSQSVESLVEERITQLQEISKRRNELLREMYHLIQKRDNLGSVIAVEQDGEENLQLFLDRFDLEKHPETGLIENLQEEEVALPVTPPAYSPVIGHLPVLHGAEEGTSESPVSPLPGSPLAAQEYAPEEAVKQEPQPADVAMDVDQGAANAPEDEPEVLEAPPTQPSRPASRAPSPADDGTKVTEPPDAPAPEAPSPEVRTAETSPSPARTRPASPSRAASSLESPMPQSVDHSSTVSTTEVSGTREPSIAQFSPPRPQRSPSSAPRPSGEAEDAVKAEPLDDEPMDVAEGPPGTQEQPVQVEPQRAQELSQQQSEDHITAILGPSRPASPDAQPLKEEDEQRAAIDYSIPIPSAEPEVGFTFDSGIVDGLVDVDPTPIEPFGPEPPYPLPPLSLLPIEFSRRGKTSKRERKRDKDRDKESRRDDWQPMSLTKWAAVLRANPVHRKMSRATKCLSTRDWSVGIAELRLIRTFERIEALKDAGKWSFRQIKKQRGVGGLTKTHWDYLLDEMKWMRTDFREERKWKLALAYTLAHEALEWHEAGSLEERLRRGICVLWKPPPPDDAEMAEASEPEHADGPFRDSQEGDETGVDSRDTRTPANDYNSDDDSEDEQDKEQQDVIDALEPSTALQDALEQLEESAQASQSQPAGGESVTLKPKLEEVEDLTALGNSDQPRSETAMEVDAVKAEASEGEKAKDKDASDAKAAAPEPATHPGLKSTSKNPIFGKPVAEGDGAHGKNKNKSNQYAPLRDHVVYSQFDKLFLDLDDLGLVKSMSELSTDDFSPTAPPPPPDLTSLFPDLQPYDMLDVAPAPPTGHEGRKKSDRRGDKDDPNKRAEDTTYSKLVPMSKFMQVKPTLVSTLKPSSHWKDGKWQHIEEAPIFADVDLPSARPIEDNLCALFEGGKTSIPIAHPTQLPVPPKENLDKDGHPRPIPITWTPADDALLRQMVEKYPSNWYLVAEAFNSARVTISTDIRTAWDCLSRWREKTSTGPPEDNRPGTPAAAAAAHMTTRGHKRTASQSVAAQAGSSSGGGSQSTEPKKRLRHTLMHDTLRKAAKRREAVQKSNGGPRGKPSAVHETHGSVTKMARLTPAELSRMKAEKEARDAQELLMRRRNDELARQHLLREQAQRAQGLPPDAQQPQPPHTPLMPQSAAGNGVPRPATAQAHMVQQIRGQVGISQQQQQQRIAAAAALAGANARMSPPQLAAAQAAAHFRNMAATAQGQGQGQPGQAGGSGQVPQQSSAAAALSAAAPALSAAHLSPPFGPRATSSSPGLPQRSPPLPAASPANAAVARPPSVPGQPVQMNQMMHMQNMAQYYAQHGFSQDQLQVIMAQFQRAQQQQYAAQQRQQSPAQPGQGSQGGGY
ncbi:hypothetical protein BD413DRAFT_499713 [Trametes elegans]|nr:hypothetical protein BD413DRAFT_499713 [Trametes elegans]